MTKNFFVPTLGILLITSLALGQSPPTFQAPPNVSPGAPAKPGLALVEELPPPAGQGDVQAVGPGPWQPDYQEPLVPCLCPQKNQTGGLFTTNVEYLLWFIKNERIPAPLVSANPNLSPSPLALAVATSLAQPTLGYQERPLSGARFTAGYWLVADLDPVLETNPIFPAAGVEVTGFALGERSVSFRDELSSTIIRPFFDVNNRRGSGFLVAAPGIATGTFSGNGTVSLWGLEANAWKTVFANPPGQSLRIDLLGGFRYLDFDSGLTLNSQTVFDPAPAAAGFAAFAGDRLDVTDSFRTSNSFYGVQAGFNISYITPCVIMSANMKLGVGDTHQQIRIGGSQVRTTTTGATTVSDGGLLALPSNSGSFDRNKIGLVPEVNFKFQIPIGRHFSGYAGYTLLGWSQVVRPAGQIDPSLNVNQIPNFPVGGPPALARPAVPFNDEFLFIHGLNAGVMVIW